MSVKSLLYTCTAATYRSCPSSLNTLYMYVYYVLFSSYIDDKWCLINVPRCHSSQSCTLVLLLPKLICSLIGCFSPSRFYQLGFSLDNYLYISGVTMAPSNQNISRLILNLPRYILTMKRLIIDTKNPIKFSHHCERIHC